MNQNTKEYLVNTFGASIGDCENCCLKSSCEYSDYSGYYNYRISKNIEGRCKLNTYAELFDMDQLYKISYDSAIKRIKHTITKLKLLGFEEEVYDPFIIYTNPLNGAKTWVLPKLRTLAPKTYNEISYSNNYLVCNGDTVEIYHESKPRINLFQKYSHLSLTVSGVIPTVYSINDLICLSTTEGGKIGVFILNRYGEAIIVMGVDISNISIRRTGDGYSLTGNTLLNQHGNQSDCMVNFDNRLNITRAHKCFAMRM